MEICIVTNDALLARFLILELAEAGFAAEQHADFSCAAKLYLCDLDFHTGEIPAEAVGFSYDENKRRRVQTFLPRPIDAENLRRLAASRLLSPLRHAESDTLTIDRASRCVKAVLGETGLSEKEFTLLLALCECSLLKRTDAIKLFGDGESNVVDVYMHYLRKKLKAICPRDVIKAKRGEGYSLSDAITIRYV